MKIEAQIIKQIKHTLKKYAAIEAAYLFGSFAIGTAEKNSDIDIALLFSQNTRKEQRFEMRLELIGKLARIFGRSTDIAVLNDLSSLFFKYVIIKEGQRIYQRSLNTPIDYEAGVMSEYFDFRPFLDLYNRHYVARNLQ